MFRNLLHIIDKFARMIPVGYGMTDEYRNRNLDPTASLEIFPELDERKEELALRIGILGKGSITQPWQT